MYFASILFHDVRKIESGARFMYDTLGPLLVRSFAHDSDARGPSPGAECAPPTDSGGRRYIVETEL
jgi:hypothetical protein